MSKPAGLRAARYLAEHGGTVKAAARKFGTYHTTVLDYWRRIYGNTPTPVKAQTNDIRDLLLRSASRYEARSAVALFRAVQDDWGHICERRLWRAIGWLIERGKLQRTGTRGSDGYGYIRVKQERQLA